LNSHHIVEAAFKAFARALPDGGREVDPRGAKSVPKGSKGFCSLGFAVAQWAAAGM
jgi:imidazoleglycerol phosphate dehydratase HisB